MKAGLDLGYNATKAAIEGKEIYFPSLVGTPDKARFAVNGTVESIVIQPEGMAQKLVGEGAIRQSRFVDEREDWAWVTSEKYKYLAYAAYTELTQASRVNLEIVTGLPVTRYQEDAEAVKEALSGEYRIVREGRHTQVFNVEVRRVIPQPFGTVLSQALDDKGKIQDNILATGNIGIMDIGGKTTNLLSVERLAEIGRETTSIDLGAWDIIRVIREYLAEDFKGLDYRDHEVARAVQERGVNYYGEWFDLSKEIDNALEAFVTQVLGSATQLWGKGARLNKILISGGGALLLGDYIIKQFRHAEIVKNPVFANSIGYLRFCQRL
jgi:hypothetical protein